MKIIFSKRLAVAVLSVGVSSVCMAAPTFVEDVLPIFKQHCLSCHNPDKKKADLDLSTLQGVQIGSSGGEVVKAGVPDSSVLYRVMNHHEDYEPMPPKKPKVAGAQLKIVHAWIAGGLIESVGGTSQLRDVAFELGAGSAARPENPAVPKGLPVVSMAKTVAPVSLTALACSPWVDVVAVAGHRQVHLYGPQGAAAAQPGFVPVAADDLLSHWDFDGKDAPMLKPGRIGKALFLDGEQPMDRKAPTDYIHQHGAFTFTAWLKPDPSMKSPTVYGQPNLCVLIEPKGEGWTVRAYARGADNAGTYYGRVGSIMRGAWQHVAVTCDGKEWVVYYGGKEIVRQPKAPEHPGWLKRDDPVHIGGNGVHDERKYVGGIDDLRLYNRALSAEEVGRIVSNASPRFGYLGTLPFDEGDVHDLRFSRNGELLLAAGGVGAYAGKVVIFDVKTGARQAVIGDEQDIVLSADISSDHRFVAIGTPSKMVKIFSATNGKLLHRIEKHTDWVTAVRFSPDGKFLASGDRNGGIHVWETDGAGIVYTLDEHKMKVSAFSWRPDGQVLASAGEDGKLVLWDMKDGWPTRTVAAHTEKSTSRYSKRTGVLDMRFASDGRLLTAGRDRRLKLWKTDGALLSQFAESTSLPLQAAFSADGSMGFAGTLSGAVEVWDLNSGLVVQVLEP